MRFSYKGNKLSGKKNKLFKNSDLMDTTESKWYEIIDAKLRSIGYQVSLHRVVFMLAFNR